MSKVLCLDLATKTGYALVDDQGRIIESGTWKFSKKTKDTEISRVVKLREAMKKLFLRHTDISAVVFERVGFSKFTYAHAVHNQLLSVVMLTCNDERVGFVGVAVGTLKKHATGSGKASKEQMIESAHKAFPAIQIGDDNEADALNIANWVLSTRSNLFRKSDDTSNTN